MNAEISQYPSVNRTTTWKVTKNQVTKALRGQLNHYPPLFSARVLSMCPTNRIFFKLVNKVTGIW